MTRGIAKALPPALVKVFWGMIDELPEERDYLQIFEFYVSDGRQMLRFSAEEPAHSEEYIFPYNLPFYLRNHKIYVIDDGDHSTMLFAEEY